MFQQLKHVFEEQFRFLAFRTISPDLKRSRTIYLAYIFFISWLVGLGRYWDHPDAYWWQYAGLGSVAYIVVLSALLFVVVLPLRPQRWTFLTVLIFVGLTALPGLLYAIPVERFMSLNAAQSVNAWFLGVVAIWRVALYVRFLHGVAALSPFRLVVALLLPLSGIVTALSLLNLEHVVFDIMAGIREENATPNDAAYSVVLSMSLMSIVAFPLTLTCYILAIYLSRKKSRPERAT